MKKIIFLSLITAGLTLGATAHAGGVSIRLNLGLPVPVFAPPVVPFFAPAAPVYIAPSPVYVDPYPPYGVYRDWDRDHRYYEYRRDYDYRRHDYDRRDDRRHDRR